MNINKIQNNLYISSQAESKSNSVEEASFEKILNANIKKEVNLNTIFEDASNKYSIPNKLLKAVAKVESNYNPNAVSSSGASGIMQLMPDTARGLGVTDVFDVEQNIHGGAKYLSQLYKKYEGNLELTLAGYNAGPGNVAKYGGVPPFKETQNYIVKVNKALNDEGVDIDLMNSSIELMNPRIEDYMEYNSNNQLQSWNLSEQKTNDLSDLFKIATELIKFKVTEKLYREDSEDDKY